jgi:hypothetical protein
VSVIRVTLELSPEAAAGLKRFADKVTHEDAKQVLYPHVRADVRTEQAYSILEAFAEITARLADARVRDWPWIDTGVALEVEAS